MPSIEWNKTKFGNAEGFPNRGEVWSEPWGGVMRNGMVLYCHG